MSAKRAYLDYNASAPLLPEAREAMLAALEVPANASSVHRDGRLARRMVDEARRKVAALAGADPAHVVFTSGASEAAAWLLSPDWRMGRGALRFSRLYVGATEHPCVLSGGRFAPEDVERLPVDRDGIVDLLLLEARLAAHDRNAGLPLVAIQAANNETGVIQPLADAERIVNTAGGVLIVDAVQAAGRIPVDISESFGDFIILSSHKIGGPKGAGAVAGKADLMMPLPLVLGGGQERGHRAGTENVAAIAGFGVAAAVAAEKLGDMNKVRALRDRLEGIVAELAADAVFYGREAPRLANTSFFSLPGMKAETMQIAFDLAGVSLSAGSACSSGKVGPSHVLKAMGFGDDVSALRVSLGHSTADSEIETFRAALAELVSRRASAVKAA